MDAPSDVTTDPRHGIGGNNPPTPIEEILAALPGSLTAGHSKRMAEIIDAIAKRANDAPAEIGSDAELASAGDIVTDARDAWKEFDEKRKQEKDPFKTGVETVDNFFRDPLARLSRIMDAFEARGSTYNRKKRAQAEAATERKRLADEAEAARVKAQVANEFGDTDEAIGHLQTAASAETQLEEAAAAPSIAADMTVRGAGGSVSRSKTEWTFEIVEADKIDLNALRNFIAPEAIEKALKQLVKIQKGNAKVTGVRFYEDEKSNFKRR